MKQTGRQRERGLYLVFANQITLQCVNKTLNPFGISKLLNTITLAVTHIHIHTHCSLMLASSTLSSETVWEREVRTWTRKVKGRYCILLYDSVTVNQLRHKKHKRTITLLYLLLRKVTGDKKKIGRIIMCSVWHQLQMRKPKSEIILTWSEIRSYIFRPNYEAFFFYFFIFTCIYVFLHLHYYHYRTMCLNSTHKIPT